MADKPKLSTAEILALARKQGAMGSGGASAAAPPPAKPAEAPKAAAKPAAPKADAPAKPAGGARPSTADILAAARAQKAASPTEGAPAAEKPAAKPTAAPKAEKPAEPAAPPVEAKNTSNILSGAADKPAKPGPVSKAAAAAKPAPAKPARPVPPMPVKPEYAKAKPAKAATEERRGVVSLIFGSFLALGFTSLSATTGLWTLGMARFMFPNILTEPPSKFKVGPPNDFPPGKVEEKFKALFGIWVVNAEYAGQRQIVAIRTVCTHLGCTPNWLEGEQKYKCPCHGSGFYKDGINFEGPAPRPLERYAIRLADDGQLEVDKSKLFQEELGQWADPACFVAV